MICPICSWSTEDQEYLFINESRFWRIVLAPNQILVGRCVIHLKRHCGDIAEIKPDELLDWNHNVNIIETALKKAFNPTMFNWSSLMNLSYQKDPPNPHIHWWVVPRYNHSVKISNYQFNDPLFGKPYDHSMRLELPKDDRKQIVDQIKHYIPTNH
jgi:diadenosine tetraphosphate (Ap4A) HIT family hydrolase